MIVDEFMQIQCMMHLLAVLRDGFREASGYYELLAWQNIFDMALEYEVYLLNSILKDLCKTFEGLKFEPVSMSAYSLLRGLEN